LKMNARRCLVVLAGSLFVLSAQAAFCQADNFGVGVKASTLGVGVEVAAKVMESANIRAGVNVLGYSRNYTHDGIAYDGHLDFRTFEAHFDYFPWAGKFHISPGILAYSGDPIKANATVAAGQSFTLGGTTYYSDPTVPTYGTGKIDFNSVAPMVTVGFGNLIPRNEQKHFSFPVEVGVAFQGSPKATLNLNGDVCDAVTPVLVNCRAVSSDPTVLANVVAEQNKINNKMSFFKAYPIISIGFGYKF